MQALEKRADVEAGTAHHRRQPPARPDAGDGRERVPAKARRVIALRRIHDVDQVVGQRRALARAGLAGADVHAAIDLAGVGVHHLQAQAGGQAHRHVGLAHRGGADRDEEWRMIAGLHHQVRRSSLRISRRDRRETMGRPWGQK